MGSNMFFGIAAAARTSMSANDHARALKNEKRETGDFRASLPFKIVSAREGYAAYAVTVRLRPTAADPRK